MKKPGDRMSGALLDHSGPHHGEGDAGASHTPSDHPVPVLWQGGLLYHSLSLRRPHDIPHHGQPAGEAGLDKIETFRDRSLNFSKPSVKVSKLRQQNLRQKVRNL